MGLIWILSIVATMVVADQKNRSVVGFFFLSLVSGPIGLIVALLVAPHPRLGKNAPYIPQSTGNIRQEIASIKTTLAALQERIDTLERQAGVVSEPPPAVSGEPVKPLETSAAAASPGETPKNEAFEFVLGKYWLSRIGVVLFVVGIGLFIRYTFQYFSPVAKIAIGYFFAAVFLVWGEHLEKKPVFRRLSWAVLGGAWGLFYLTTYAMHYIPATRIIENTSVELVVLWIVSLFCIRYNLKYRSWVTTAMSFLLGFLTIAVGALDFSSVAFWALLLGSLGFLIYRMGWIELLVAGLIAGYGMSVVVFASKLDLYRFFRPVDFFNFRIGFALLTVTWGVFALTILALKLKDRLPSRPLVPWLISNTCLYAVLGLGLISRLDHLSAEPRKFSFLIILALTHAAFAVFNRVTGKPRYIVLHSALSIMLASLAVFIKYPQLSLSFWWVLETVMLFGLGLYYKEKAYRLMGWVVGLGVLVRFVSTDLLSTAVYPLGPWMLPHHGLVTVAASGAYLLLGIVVHSSRAKAVLSDEEMNFYLYSFPMAAALVPVMWMGQESAAFWLTLHWTVLGLGLLAVGFVLKYKALRFSALGVLAIACGRIVTFDLAGVDTIYKIIVVIFLGAVLLGISLIYSRVKQNP